MNGIIKYPPNTKDADAIINGRTVIVNCPHCRKKHYYPKEYIYHSYIAAHCKKGYYVLRVTP